MKMETLNLGKLLVNELGLESSVDTLSRWIAHYIAQLMTEMESSTGADKCAKEEKCFEAILKLWKHRAYFEGNKNPFEGFIPIFQTLEKLNPDNENPFYFRSSFSRRSSEGGNEENAINQYLQLALKIDEISRVWIQFVLQQATELATDTKTKEWIAAATPFAANDEVSLISCLLSGYNADADNAMDSTEALVEIIERRIEQLCNFREFNEELIALYTDELKRIQSF